MAKPSKLGVMISSRSNDKFPPDAEGRPLSEIRRDIKTEIEGLEVFGKKIFEVWINEETPPQGGTWDSWEVCLKAVMDCDILVTLSNGNAGWAKDGSDIGICYAELMKGLSHAPGKVRLISLGNVPITNNPEGQRNERFQSYVESQSLFRGGTVTTESELKARVNEAVLDGLIRLAQAGVREASKGKFHAGEALDWSRLSFDQRTKAMRKVLHNALANRPQSTELDENKVLIKLNKQPVLVLHHAIPAALGIPAAREKVGQPFLEDYKQADILKDNRAHGPFHLIACQKTATENQALKLLGFPDATVVTAPFGVFVADNIQKVQFAFIINCRDETTTRHGVQRFFEWLEQTGEEQLVAERAKSRARIVRAIAKEVEA